MLRRVNYTGPISISHYVLLNDSHIYSKTMKVKCMIVTLAYTLNDNNDLMGCLVAVNKVVVSVCLRTHNNILR